MYDRYEYDSCVRGTLLLKLPETATPCYRWRRKYVVKTKDIVFYYCIANCLYLLLVHRCLKSYHNNNYVP